MAKITYVEHDGTAHVVEVADGKSVMEGAVNNNIPGIDADCGGACACATCHVYVRDEWFEITGKASEIEASLLEFAASEEKPTSRLACQLQVSDALDGLVVDMPATQR